MCQACQEDSVPCQREGMGAAAVAAICTAVMFGGIVRMIYAFVFDRP